MSQVQDNTLARSFLLRLTPEQAYQIDEFRWAHRQNSQAAAVRKLLDLGLKAVKSGNPPPQISAPASAP